MTFSQSSTSNVSTEMQLSSPAPMPSEWSCPLPPSKRSSPDEPQKLSSPAPAANEVAVVPTAETYSGPGVPVTVQEDPYADRSALSNPMTVAATGPVRSNTRSPVVMSQSPLAGAGAGFSWLVSRLTWSSVPAPPDA